MMADNVKSKGEDAAMMAPGRPAKSVSAGDAGAAAANREPSELYEACMKAYRWISRRYRKTLDTLAK